MAASRPRFIRNHRRPSCAIPAAASPLRNDLHNRYRRRRNVHRHRGGSAGRPHHHGQGRVNPARPIRRRARRRGTRRARAWPDAGRPARRHLAHRPRHDSRHQRAAGRQGRAGRHADHGGPPRHHRDARGSEARTLQSAHDPAGTAGAAAAPPAGARAHARRWFGGTCAGPGVARPGGGAACRRGSAGGRRCASCIPGAIRRTSRRRPMR